MKLQEAIQKHSVVRKDSLRYLPIEKESVLAAAYSVSKKDILIESCFLEIMPERYSRNYKTYSIQEQGILLQSRVGVVGMGGLGGCILEMLARVGIGTIVCADGDCFEASNLNRQAFSSESVLGVEKASVGIQMLNDISSITECTGIHSFLDKEGIHKSMVSVDIGIDALGGLKDKPMLVESFHELGIPVVASSIAGLCGYVYYVPVGGVSPTDWLGNGSSIEEQLGNLPQTVFFAGACVVQMVLDVLLGKKNESYGFIFDIEKGIMDSVSM